MEIRAGITGLHHWTTSRADAILLMISWRTRNTTNITTSKTRNFNLARQWLKRVTSHSDRAHNLICRLEEDLFTRSRFAKYMKLYGLKRLPQPESNLVLI